MDKEIVYNLENDLELGEGQFIEFKENLDKSMAKEIVAFANASGGSIYLGVTDDCIVTGISVTNRLNRNYSQTIQSIFCKYL